MTVDFNLFSEALNGLIFCEGDAEKLKELRPDLHKQLVDLKVLSSAPQSKKSSLTMSIDDKKAEFMELAKGFQSRAQMLAAHQHKYKVGKAHGWVDEAFPVHVETDDEKENKFFDLAKACDNDRSAMYRRNQKLAQLGKEMGWMNKIPSKKIKRKSNLPKPTEQMITDEYERLTSTYDTIEEMVADRELIIQMVAMRTNWLEIDFPDVDPKQYHIKAA